MKLDDTPEEKKRRRLNGVDILWRDYPGLVLKELK
jgi:hypothetical protein